MKYTLFYMSFFWLSTCWTMYDTRLVKKNKSALHLNLSPSAHKKRRRHKRTNSLSELSPRNNFRHVMHLIENDGSALTPRYITSLTATQCDENKNTALHMAARIGNYGLIELLVMNNADTNQQNKEGNTPLHIATQYKHITFMRMLIKLGNKAPNVNTQNNVGETALHIATRTGNSEAIKLLLMAGTDPSLRNKQQETAQDIAEKKEIRHKFPALKKIIFEPHTLDKLLKIKAHFSNLIDAIRNNDLHKTDKYLEKINVNSIDECGNTSLHIALSCQCYEIAKLLLKKGANPNKINNLGDTPLHCLIKATIQSPKNNKESKKIISIIKKLIYYNSDLHIKNNEGHTIFSLAKEYEDENLIDIFQPYFNSSFPANHLLNELKKKRNHK